MAYTQGARITLPSIGTQQDFTHYAGMSLMDIQMGLDISKGASNVGSETVPDDVNNIKAYLYDGQWEHTWRNNSSAPYTLTFYKITPRSAVPNWAKTATAMSNIAPASEYTHTACVRVANPVGADTMTAWTNPIEYDLETLTGAATFTGSELALTPYNNTMLTRAYKIKPIRVSKEGVKAHNVMLKPGQQCSLMTKRTKPFSVNFHKFHLDSRMAATIHDAYECLPSTPLLFIQMKGVPVHDSADQSKVTSGKGWCDYVRTCRLRHARATTLTTQRYNPYATMIPTFTGTVEVHEEESGTVEEEKNA